MRMPLQVYYRVVIQLSICDRNLRLQPPSALLDEVVSDGRIDESPYLVFHPVGEKRKIDPSSSSPPHPYTYDKKVKLSSSVLSSEKKYVELHSENSENSSSSNDEGGKPRSGNFLLIYI